MFLISCTKLLTFGVCVYTCVRQGRGGGEAGGVHRQGGCGPGGSGSGGDNTGGGRGRTRGGCCGWCGGPRGCACQVADAELGKVEGTAVGWWVCGVGATLGQAFVCCTSQKNDYIIGRGTPERAHDSITCREHLVVRHKKRQQCRVVVHSSRSRVGNRVVVLRAPRMRVGVTWF